ncbi:DUF2958 domain-containing protein [Nitrosomonas supralitoralis]|uniref:Uncharacterized protein n=1 Tax=Nitrosomonas supralitoralis TaxID=2116706 RepID=A0A2P7NR87_9PROT|nr:hypothetical protein [Nitrosomonas supralitoralis]PSJ15983.1 hypothetical protein C7H79_16035 [Nitrosomonas supralitoralis]
MTNSVYKVLTPAGQFDAIFAEDEDIPIEYSGDELAICFFKDWLFINQISGSQGYLLDSDKLTPADLYGFCQPLNSGIEVIPPFDDFMSYTQEDIAMPRDELDSAIISDEVKNTADLTFDGISGMDKIKLIKEVGSIRVNLKTVQSGIEKLKMVKRIKEIRDALGVGSSGGLDNNGLDADGMWPMTRAEYDKIHSDFKGTLPDRTLTALKLINGATTVVPVKITGEQQKDPEPEGEPQTTVADVNNVMPLLKNFIGAAQLAAVGSLIRGEEGQFFKDKLIEIANEIKTMPKTYDQDGMGDKAIAYLHYFKGSGDWYITEKDMEDDQIQAFGLADIFGDGGELGYINIEEIIQHGVELDFHWTPKTLGQIRGTDSKDETQGTQAGDESSEINDPAETTETPEDASPEDSAKSGFISELESLKAETDIIRFNERLDEIAARVEQAGLMEALDIELNDTADVLTALLSAAESGGK